MGQTKFHVKNNLAERIQLVVQCGGGCDLSRYFNFKMHCNRTTCNSSLCLWEGIHVEQNQCLSLLINRSNIIRPETRECQFGFATNPEPAAQLVKLILSQQTTTVLCVCVCVCVHGQEGSTDSLYEAVQSGGAAPPQPVPSRSCSAALLLEESTTPPDPGRAVSAVRCSRNQNRPTRTSSGLPLSRLRL